MKSTGIVRHIDSLGRVVIPKELRRTLDLNDPMAPVEIFVEGNKVIIQKYDRGCHFCGSVNVTIHRFYDKSICTNCINEIVKVMEDKKNENHG